MLVLFQLSTLHMQSSNHIEEQEKEKQPRIKTLK